MKIKYTERLIETNIYHNFEIDKLKRKSLFKGIFIGIAIGAIIGVIATITTTSFFSFVYIN